MKSEGWPPVSVKQRLVEHGELVKLVRRCADSDDVSGPLARYLVVRSAGLVEAVRDDVTDVHCSVVGNKRLHRRIASGLRTGQGARPSQLLEFVGTMDIEWRGELDQFFKMDDAKVSNNLGALIEARKKVAHGDGEQITTGKALRWAETSRDVAQWLIQRFDPR